MFKVLAFLIEVVNWIRIVLSPTLIGGIIGVLIYSSNENTTGLFIGGTFCLAGFVVGIIWATKVWKRKGTTQFMSRIHASPDIDEATKPKDSDK
jgi:hypothetical protein